MIYDSQGNRLSAVYDASGNMLSAAYNKAGEQIFPDGPIPMFPLKVMNYNVGGWYNGSGTNVPAGKASAYLEMQNQIFAEIDADIACLEEYWTYFSGTTSAETAIINQHFPYSHSVNGTNTYFGRCVCSKYPIESYAQNQFTDDTVRYYDDAVINVNGKLIHVIVTHFNTSSNPQSRVEEANTIFNYLQTHGITDFVVCGDFNVSVLHPLSEYNLQVFGSFLNAGCKLANGGDFGVFETYSRNSQYNDNLAVDNIIIPSQFTLENVSVNMTKVTFQATNGDKIDHIPLVAEIEIPE